MSQWTHIQGVVRFEYWLENMWPVAPEYNPIQTIQIIDKLFCQAFTLPSGSEGPVGAHVIYGGRGPVLVLEGDLREFGKENLKQFTCWLNRQYEELQQMESEGKKELSIRDCWVNFDVEYDDTIYAIMFNDDENKNAFELREYTRKPKET